jgi:hypothetical protein
MSVATSRRAGRALRPAANAARATPTRSAAHSPTTGRPQPGLSNQGSSSASHVAEPLAPVRLVVPVLHGCTVHSSSHVTDVRPSTGTRSPSEQRSSTTVRVIRQRLTLGATLAELAEILHRPGWLRDEDVELVTFVAGEIPVQLNSQDTIVRVRPFGLTGGQVDLAIYLRISGRLSAREVVAALRGDAADRRILDARILEIGLLRPAPDREP